MYCYKCGCELNSGSKCPNCGSDMRQFKKIIYTSNYLYNEGLAKAQVKDLSGAIIALKNAIWYNKSNLDARNLLGLCYYEMGETVAALSEWIIAKNINDSGLKIKNNLADHYIAEVQNSKQLLDNMNTAIQRYNHALDCCKTDNLDVAVLQLRKVLNLNSHYLRARQLLALVYMEQQQWGKAQKELRKCLLLDINNTTTLRYLQEVESKLSPEAGPESGARKKKKSGNSASAAAVTRIGIGRGARKNNVRSEGGVIKYTADNETIIQPAGSRIPGVDGFGIPGAAVGGVIGLLVGAILITFLVMPSRVAKVRQDAATQVREVSAQLDSKEAEIADLTSQLEEQQASGTSGGDLSAGDEAQVNALLAAASAYLADSSNENGNVTAAFAQIDHANVSSLSDAYQTLYNTIKSAIGSDMLDYYYLAGSQAYEAASPDYETTITNLENALLFDSDTSPSQAHPQILYYLGDSYYRGYLQSRNAGADDAATAASTADTTASDGETDGESDSTSTAAQTTTTKDDYIVKAETYLGQVVNDYADSSYAARAWSDINAIAADAELAALAGDALIEANTDAAVTTSDTVDSAVNGADSSVSATTVTRDQTQSTSTVTQMTTQTTAAQETATTSTASQETSADTTASTTAADTTAATTAAGGEADTSAADTSAADAEALAAATAAAQAAYAAAINSGASEVDAMAAANAAIGQ